MSVRRETELRCDTYDCPARVYARLGKDARRAAVKDGWRIELAGGRDLCSEHRWQASEPDAVVIVRLVDGDPPEFYDRRARRIAAAEMLATGVPRRIIAQRLRLSLPAARRLCSRIVAKQEGSPHVDIGP